MFLELVDALRCPRPHELTWLVAVAHRLEDRDILDGELGCPVCGARYPIARGVADLRGGADRAAFAVPPMPDAATLAERALRAAALLDLTEPGGVAVLAGSWAASAHEVVALTEQVSVLAIDPPADVTSGFGVSIVLAPDLLPLRPASVRAVAMDADHATSAFLASSAEALRPDGRLIAPASARLPGGLVTLAQDAEHIVARKVTLAAIARSPHIGRP